ncbi:aryl-sulfate sulfotransferase [Lentibacillus amyloliquefaciens]|uniref:Aryl-sulfate sulfotransferase n=1 Tax=Lentibacillus amyloliquefaciens TaxID=1472767 RepID=A0A0U4EHI6_9BACI|nr:aryl-sulfate sulfotransferase [Lentibacillus amyloliquefaciens]ALX49929.1 aryl-sulfate sulfotransferase [Lentibacillus amyloliquefaciens]
MKRFISGVTIGVTGLFVIIILMNTSDNQVTGEHNANAEESSFKYPPQKAQSLLNEQDELEASLLAESKGSTLNDPYVKRDPYGRSPLSALVIFDTEKPASVSFTVKGKTAEADISKSFNDYKTHHEMPVVGLYPNQENEVHITVETENGDTMENTVTVTTEELPDYIPDISIKTAETSKMEIGNSELTFAIPSTKFVYGFDINGDIRWYGSGYNSHVLQELNNGNLLYLGKDDNSGTAYNRLFETDYIGKLYNAFKISEEAAHAESKGLEATLIHHDVAELPSGNLLLTVNDGEGQYMEDTMVEIDRETGDVVKQIDLKDLFPTEAYEEHDSTEPKEGLVDWFHQNSVTYDESDKSIIISGRNSDTVMKINYATEEVQWVLAYPKGWYDEMEDDLLKAVGGNDFKYPAGQHDARILPDFDNNPDTLDLMLYDNNIVVTRGDRISSKQFSAANHYRINEETKEVEMIWSYGEELGEDYFTAIIGSSRYQEDSGNVLINFGHVDKGNQSNIVEVTHPDHTEKVFEAEITDFPKGAWVYRAKRNALYTDTWENQFSLSE